MDHPLIMMFDFIMIVVLMVLMLIFGRNFIHVSQLNTYTNETEQIVRRTGGYNQSSQEAANKVGQIFYTGGSTEDHDQNTPMFYTEPVQYTPGNSNSEKFSSVDSHNKSLSNKENQKVPYNHPIYYRIIAHIPLSFNWGQGTNANAIDTSSERGTLIRVSSQVRTGTQNNVYDNYPVE